jgi:hypothetical protein
VTLYTVRSSPGGYGTRVDIRLSHIQCALSMQGRSENRTRLDAHTKHMGDHCRGLTAHSTLRFGAKESPCESQHLRVSTSNRAGAKLTFLSSKPTFLSSKLIFLEPRRNSVANPRAPSRATQPRCATPSMPGCVPLDYSGNSGANGRSNRGADPGTLLPVVAPSAL